MGRWCTVYSVHVYLTDSTCEQCWRATVQVEPVSMHRAHSSSTKCLCRGDWLHLQAHVAL